MRAAAPLALVLALPLVLASCVATVDDGTFSAAPIETSPVQDDPFMGLSRGQKAALEQGCIARYVGNPEKLRRCLNGDTRLMEAAMEQGCHERYSGNRKKLERCLDAAEGAGWPW